MIEAQAPQFRFSTISAALFVPTGLIMGMAMGSVISEMLLYSIIGLAAGAGIFAMLWLVQAQGSKKNTSKSSLSSKGQPGIGMVYE